MLDRRLLRVADVHREDVLFRLETVFRQWVATEVDDPGLLHLRDVDVVAFGTGHAHRELQVTDHFHVVGLGDVDHIEPHPAHGGVAVLATLLDGFRNEQRHARAHPGRTVAGTRVGLEHRLVLRVTDDLAGNGQHVQQLGIARVGHVPGLVAGVVQVVGVFGQCVLVARCGGHVHHVAPEVGGNITHTGALLLADRRIRVFDVGGAGSNQFPVVRQRAIHLVDLEALEMLGLADGLDFVRLAVLVAQHAKTANLEGLDHDVLAQFLVPLHRRRAEHIVRGIGVFFLARAVRAPGRALGEHQLHVFGVGDIEDLQVAAHVLVEVALAVEVDDVLPGVKRLDRDRVVGLDGHVLDVAFGVPVIQLASERLTFMAERRGHRVGELTRRLVHAITARGRHRWDLVHRQGRLLFDEWVADIDRCRAVRLDAGAQAQHHAGAQRTGQKRHTASAGESHCFHYSLQWCCPGGQYRGSTKCRSGNR